MKNEYNITDVIRVVKKCKGSEKYGSIKLFYSCLPLHIKRI